MTSKPTVKPPYKSRAVLTGVVMAVLQTLRLLANHFPPEWALLAGLLKDEELGVAIATGVVAWLVYLQQEHHWKNERKDA